MTHHDALVTFALEVLRYPAPVVAPPGLVDEEIGVEDIGEGVDEAVGVELARSEADDVVVHSNPTDWTTRLVVTCFARKDQREVAAGRRSRAVHALVHDRLMVDPTFGGRVFHLSPPSLAFEGRGADTRLGVTTAIYTLRHRTTYLTMQEA